MKPVFKFFRTYVQNFIFAFIVVLATVSFTTIFTYIYFAKDLNEESLMNKSNSGIILLDRNNQPFFKFFDAKEKTPIPISKVSDYTKEAVISAEDSDFYVHPGFSIKGIIRALFLDIKEKKTAYGGSTITQQLVKNALLNSKKSFFRKYQEIILAEEIERRYTKNQILEMYLNSVYFGEGAYGIEEAAKTYFGKHASQLNLSESAMLAGLLASPSQFSPITGNAYLTKVRQDYVLNEMYKHKYINRSRLIAAKNEKLKLNYTVDINYEAPHFAILVRDELIRKYGEEELRNSGFIVKTTLDLNLQRYAQQVVADQVKKLAGNRVTNGAAVVMDPKTGEILAMVGSKSWYDNEFGKMNMAITPRQTGSAFKPIVYVAAFERGLITPATILKDVPTTFSGGYAPRDYDGRFRGNVTVRRALSNSLNVPSVQVMSMVGVDSAMEMAKRLGINSLLDPSTYGLSLVLGTGEVKLVELTEVYSVFANSGVKNDPADILSITDKSGKQIYEYYPDPEVVLSPDHTFLISSILSDSNSRREIFGNTLDNTVNAAVKTGTTENYRDSWTMGYTPSVVVGAWVGNNNNIPMDNVAGSLGAAPIWKALAEHYLAGKPVESFAKPEGVITSLCRGKDASSSAKVEYFIKGTESQLCPTNILTPKVSPAQTITSTPPISTIAPSNTPTLKPTSRQ
ncbi:MAG: PBP1A family penicillin-binding protein [Patescibacteria group bacterium]|nr:PBP1A family penicillin-binding protein [Patescibacteria group bacterium]